MMDYYLKTKDEEALNVALNNAELMTEDGQLVDGVLIDVIGTIYKQTGEEEITPVEGYHANLRVMCELSDEQIALLQENSITAPNTPYRVWA